MAHRPGKSPLDFGHLEAQTFGDRDLQRDLLALFTEQCAALLPTILRGVGTDASDAAHTLRGSALAVGAFAVASASAELERAGPTGGAGRESTVAALVASVDDALRAARSAGRVLSSSA